MHGTKEERLAIAKRIHDGELTLKEASDQYNIPRSSIRNWVSQYRESIGVARPVKKSMNNVLSRERVAYENMTRDELIDALILAKANELRAKKGYEVRGVGADKEFIISNEESSK
ncbi:MAG: transposase [Saccharofermentanaceae bacterium]|jgi:transposase|nr:transposase [Saccharofermentanaceae bacterium]